MAILTGFSPVPYLALHSRDAFVATKSCSGMARSQAFLRASPVGKENTRFVYIIAVASGEAAVVRHYSMLEVPLLASRLLPRRSTVSNATVGEE